MKKRNQKIENLSRAQIKYKIDYARVVYQACNQKRLPRLTYQITLESLNQTVTLPKLNTSGKTQQSPMRIKDF